MPREWNCSHCEYSSFAADKRTLLDRVKKHLVSEGGGILVYNSPERENEAGACTGLLTARSPSESGILWITRTPGERLDIWKSAVDEWPKQLHLLVPPFATVDESLFDRPAIQSGPVELITLEDGSLQKLGRQVVETTTELSQNCQHVSACFNNLSGVIHNFGNQPVFKLVHILNKKMRASDILLHYHITPETHIESTLHIFRQEFQLLRDWSGDDNELVLL